VISGTTTAAAAGTFELGDRTVDRLGLGAMRLTGTGDLGHLEQNVAAAALRLTEDDLARLGSLA
jgi:pyridoxine 4-dehydrogenase